MGRGRSDCPQPQALLINFVRSKCLNMERYRVQKYKAICLYDVATSCRAFVSTYIGFTHVYTRRFASTTLCSASMICYCVVLTLRSDYIGCHYGLVTLHSVCTFWRHVFQFDVLPLKLPSSRGKTSAELPDHHDAVNKISHDVPAAL